jgi:hypothetical protein
LITLPYKNIQKNGIIFYNIKTWKVAQWMNNAPPHFSNFSSLVKTLKSSFSSTSGKTLLFYPLCNFLWITFFIHFVMFSSIMQPSQKSAIFLYYYLAKFHQKEKLTKKIQKFENQAVLGRGVKCF